MNVLTYKHEQVLEMDVPILTGKGMSYEQLQRFEQTPVMVRGSRTSLNLSVEVALKEKCPAPIALDIGSAFVENIRGLAVGMAEGILPTEISAKGPIAQVACVNNSRSLIQAIDKEMPLVGIKPYPYIHKDVLHNSLRFRILTNTDQIRRVFQKQAIIPLIGEWIQARTVSMPEEQVRMLSEIAALSGKGWDFLAITLGAFSPRIEKDTVEKWAKRNKAREYVEYLYSMDFDERRRNKHQIAGLFSKGTADVPFMNRYMRFEIPYVFGMDLGSVMRDKLQREGKTAGAGVDLGDLYDQCGSVMFYKPIDVFGHPMDRVTSDKNLFLDKPTSQVAEAIENFIETGYERMINERDGQHLRV